MVTDIGEIIIDRIKDLSFMDKYAGVVRVMTREDVSNNKKTIQTFPVKCTLNDDECAVGGRYLDLCPDSKKKSVLYLEDNGLRFRAIDGFKVSYTASFDLVCWLNSAQLGKTQCSYSGAVITNIIRELIGKGVPQNYSPYQRVFIKPISQRPKNINPFSKYSYDLNKSQILMYPYEWFVIGVDVDFMIDARCIDQFVIGSPDECLTK